MCDSEGPFCESLVKMLGSASQTYWLYVHIFAGLGSTSVTLASFSTDSRVETTNFWSPISVGHIEKTSGGLYSLPLAVGKV